MSRVSSRSMHHKQGHTKIVVFVQNIYWEKTRTIEYNLKIKQTEFTTAQNRIFMYVPVADTPPPSYIILYIHTVYVSVVCELLYLHLTGV